MAELACQWPLKGHYKLFLRRDLLAQQVLRLAGQEIRRTCRAQGRARQVGGAVRRPPQGPSYGHRRPTGCRRQPAASISTCGNTAATLCVAVRRLRRQWRKAATAFRRQPKSWPHCCGHVSGGNSPHWRRMTRPPDTGRNSSATRRSRLCRRVRPRLAECAAYYSIDPRGQ